MHYKTAQHCVEIFGSGGLSYCSASVGQVQKPPHLVSYFPFALVNFHQDSVLNYRSHSKDVRCLDLCGVFRYYLSEQD